MLKDCYWVYAEKTLSSNTILQLYLKGKTCDFYSSVIVCPAILCTVVNTDAFLDWSNCHHQFESVDSAAESGFH